MKLYFGRNVELRIGLSGGEAFSFSTDIPVDGVVNDYHAISFDIKSDTTQRYNTGEFTIHNPSSRFKRMMTVMMNSYEEVRDTLNINDKIGKWRDIPSVEFYAGHGKDRSLLFKGEISHISSDGVAPDVSMKVSCVEGATENRLAVIRKSYGPSTKLSQILSDCTEALERMGITMGDSLSSYIKGYLPEDPIRTTSTGKPKAAKRSEVLANTILNNGYTATETALGLMNHFLKNFGMTASIAGGSLLIHNKREPSYENKKPLLVSAISGLVGAIVRKDRDQIEFKCLIHPNIKVGYEVVIVSVVDESLNGSWIINSVSYSGDNRVGDFTATVTATSMEPRYLERYFEPTEIPLPFESTVIV
jgi:hypothetical protein